MSKRELMLLRKKVFNTPQMVMSQDILNIVEYMADPVRTEFERTPIVESLKRDDFEKDEEYREYRLKQLNINPETMQGFLNIEGTLVNRAGNVQACVELTSYEKLKSTMKAQIEMGARDIVMVIDSGGGEAYGCFATAASLRKMADDNDVQLVAYVDGYACSAAYALASAAHEIVANPQATVGSVGVVVQLMNNNEALKKAGYSRTFVYAGDSKIPFDKEGEFDKEFISKIQGSINKTYKRFTNLVATNRGLQEADVVNTQASVYDADEALTIGFVDKLMETEDFFENYVPSLRQTTNNSTKMETEENMTLEELQAMKAKAQAAGHNVIELNAETESVISLSDLTELRTKAASLDAATELTTQLKADLTASVKRVEELENDVLTAQADAIIVSRTAKLEAVLGTENEQVLSILQATASLEDSAFDIVCASYQGSFDKKELEMKEVGKTPEAGTERLTLEQKIALKLSKNA